jgi:GxxExxY protein
MANHNKEKLNEISSIVVAAAIDVHKEMGPGLLESVYQHCLVKEFRLRDMPTEVTVSIPLKYKGFYLNKDYVADIIVDQEVILELKAVEGILPVHEAQIISYLKLADKRLGFILNFNVPLMKNGIKRFVNGF